MIAQLWWWPQGREARAAREAREAREAPGAWCLSRRLLDPESEEVHELINLDPGIHCNFAHNPGIKCSTMHHWAFPWVFQAGTDAYARDKHWNVCVLVLNKLSSHGCSHKLDAPRKSPHIWGCAVFLGQQGSLRMLSFLWVFLLPFCNAEPGI